METKATMSFMVEKVMMYFGVMKETIYCMATKGMITLSVTKETIS